MGFIQELKRRSVIRVGIAYAVIGWLFLQVADILLDFTGAPDWVGKVIIALLLLGFIPSVIIAWVFEITPEGIRRDDGQVRPGDGARAQRLNLATIAAVAVLIALMFWQRSTGPQTVPTPVTPPEVSSAVQVETEKPAEQAVTDASIAVLPFADLSPGKDQGYFSDGIAEEILNVLVRVDGLSVASRTSAFGFKGQDALGIPAIARELKVRNILEGSVRKSGDNVRITAQLIDARTDKHLWSQTYDRVLSAENLFAIQDEIARAIVTELSKSMQLESPLPDAPMVAVATANLDAYQLYLRARDTYRQRNRENIPRIIQMLEKALELDPDYAEAWAGLAAVSVVAPSWGVEGRDFVQMAGDAAQRAIELDDSLALPYAALGSMTSNSIPTDYIKVFGYYDQALERNPNSATTLLWRGIDLMNVGRFDAAITDLEQCLVIDPVYENCRRFLALTRLFAGDTETALELFEKGVARGSTSQGSMFALAYIGEGDFRSGLLVLALADLAFNEYPGSVEALFRALTEPDFDHARELQKFMIEIEAKTGESVEAIGGLGTVYALAFRKYDAVTPDPFSAFWWHPFLPDFHASPYRNKLIRDMGIYDYWRAAGFPPQCRPLGEDDFVCD